MMSIGFMLPNPDDAVIWRGPRKNGLIKQFLKDVHWGQLDYLIIDTPPGTSDEHISIVQYLKAGCMAGAVVVTTPQEVAIVDVRKEISFCRKVRGECVFLNVCGGGWSAWKSITVRRPPMLSAAGAHAIPAPIAGGACT